jgi:hypothetical protein
MPLVDAAELTQQGEASATPAPAADYAHELSDVIIAQANAGEANLTMALLAEELGTNSASGSTLDVADAHGYDGHVALALDSDMLPTFDATLDLLTSAVDLFDVPAVDFGGSHDA